MGLLVVTTPAVAESEGEMREHSCKAMGENIKLVNRSHGWEWRRWYVGEWRYENDLLCFGIIDTEKVHCPLCKKQLLGVTRSADRGMQNE